MSVTSTDRLAQAIMQGRLSIKPWADGEWLFVVDDEAKDEGDKFLDQCRALEPADKIAALEAMGFTPIGSSHRYDCPYSIDAGNRCNCVPDPTMWSPPHDVLVYTNQTYDERRRAPREPIPDVER
jgi:hypothetical protein